MPKTYPESPQEGRQLAHQIIRFAGRIVLAGVLLCGGASLAQRVLLLRETSRAMAQQTASLRQELEAAREQRKGLEEEYDFLQTRAGLLIEAHRLGYGLPGEERLMLVPPGDSETGPKE